MGLDVYLYTNIKKIDLPEGTDLWKYAYNDTFQSKVMVYLLMNFGIIKKYIRRNLFMN